MSRSIGYGLTIVNFDKRFAVTIFWTKTWGTNRKPEPVIDSVIMRQILCFLLLALPLTSADRRIVTIAGTGTAGYSGDGGPGTKAELNNPFGLVVGPDGALYFCDSGNNCIRRLDLKSNVLTTIAGTQKRGYAGDGGKALEAMMNQPYELRFSKAGDLLFVDEMPNHVIRRIDMKTQLISTLAGTGQAGFGGDGGPAEKAQFRQPHSIAFDPEGRLLVCDIANQRVRRIDLKTGLIDTYAGTGGRGPAADGAPLEGTPLNGPRAIDLDPEGNLYLALREGNAIYRIERKSGKMFQVAGTGEAGYTGDGGPGKQAKLNGPKGVAYAPDGSLYIADTENHVIRRLDLKTGVIATVAGTGEKGDGPDGDPLKCRLSRPHGIFVDKQGVVYIGDSESHRVRRM